MRYHWTFSDNTGNFDSLNPVVATKFFEATEDKSAIELAEKDLLNYEAKLKSESRPAKGKLWKETLARAIKLW